MADPFAATALAADVVVHGPGLTHDQALFLNDCGLRRPYKQLSKAGKTIADGLVELGLLRIDEHRAGITKLSVLDHPGTLAISDVRETFRVAKEYAKKGWFGKHLQRYPHKAARGRSNKKW